MIFIYAVGKCLFWFFAALVAFFIVCCVFNAVDGAVTSLTIQHRFRKAVENDKSHKADK